MYEQSTTGPSPRAVTPDPPEVELAAGIERLGLRFPVRPWIRQFADAVFAQLDLGREAESYRVLRDNLAGITGLRIPAVVHELTTPSVLTLEFVDGLHHVDEPQLAFEDRRRALRVGLTALYRMIFVDGFVHADLHPGNVFFRRGGECVLLDAGVVARLDGRGPPRLHRLLPRAGRQPRRGLCADHP